MHNITWRITSQKLDPFSEFIVSVLINKSIFGWFIELDWWNLHHCKKKSTIQKHNLCIILGLELNLQNISKWSECAILKLCRRAARWKFPLVLMGTLILGLRMRDPPLGPISTLAEISAIRVCRVAFKHLPHLLKSWIWSFGISEINPFSGQNRVNRGGRGVPKQNFLWES